MSDFSHPLLPAALVFILAGLVKGTLGLGLPTVAVGILGLFMTPAQAAALLIVPTLATNIWQLATGPKLGVLLRRLWPLLTATAVGTWLASALLAGAPVQVATAVLGAALLIYGIIGLLKLPMRVPPTAETWAGPLVGLLTGIMGGICGNFAVPAVPYFGALNLERDDLVQTLGLFFTVSALGRGRARARRVLGRGRGEFGAGADPFRHRYDHRRLAARTDRARHVPQGILRRAAVHRRPVGASQLLDGPAPLFFCHSCAKRENPEVFVFWFKTETRNLWILGPAGQE
jgi:hypothetical protein